MNTMKIKSKRILISIVLLFSALTASSLYYYFVYNSTSEIEVHANYIAYNTIEDLEKAADLIIIGTPTSEFQKRTHKITFDDDGTMLDFYTLTDIKIEKIIKNANNTALELNTTIQIVEPVGMLQTIVGKQKYKIDNYNEMLENNQYIIFLKKNTYDVYSIINMNSGKYNLKNDNEEQKINRNLVIDHYKGQVE